MPNIVLFMILGYRKLKLLICKPIWKWKTKIIFKGFGVKFSKYITLGVPYVYVKNGIFRLGKDFRMNNNYAANIIGRQQKCIFMLNGGNLVIGDNVGISSTAIVCHDSIIIGNNVRIGGNTVIYDTDFHSLDYRERIAFPEQKIKVKTKAVRIGNNVFIGGHTTILKGSAIGDNSIIGAGSVVSGTIAANEIWGGNPARYIKSL